MKNRILTNNKRTILAVSVALALSGCAVGPHFKTPSSPVSAEANESYSYTAKPVSLQTEESEGNAGTVQKFIAAKNIPGQWWEIFHSEQLDALIRSALERSPDLASAQAALRQAQENYSASSGSLYPNVTANYIPERDKSSQTSAAAGGRLYSLNTANVTVNYTVDVFGGVKRNLESMQAQVEYQQFQVEAAYLTLTTNLVTSAINEASYRAQIKAQKEILAYQTKQLEVVENKFTIGAINKTDVLNQRTLVAQTRAALPALEKSLQQTRNQLAVYAGRLPSDADLPEFDLDALKLPNELPVSIPSELVRQRPDIRANEALLHQYSALIGVATANQYPQFSLTASYGSVGASGAMGSIPFFSGPAEMWRLAGGITQTIFDAGALSAKRRAAVANYDQAHAKYRSTVLGAFKNVADSLLALDLDAKTLKQQQDVVASAKQTLDLANMQFGFGAISAITLLDAKRTFQLERINLIKAQAARYTDTAALFQSMGGGWWNRSELKDISSATE